MRRRGERRKRSARSAAMSRWRPRPRRPRLRARSPSAPAETSDDPIAGGLRQASANSYHRRRDGTGQPRSARTSGAPASRGGCRTRGRSPSPKRARLRLHRPGENGPPARSRAKTRSRPSRGPRTPGGPVSRRSPQRLPPLPSRGRLRHRFEGAALDRSLADQPQPGNPAQRREVTGLAHRRQEHSHGVLALVGVRPECHDGGTPRAMTSAHSQLPISALLVRRMCSYCGTS